MRPNLIGLSFAAALSILAVSSLPASAFCLFGFIGECGGPGHGSSPGPTRPVPGPIAGAGLPVLAVGYGVYWLLRRSRKNSQ